jgi:hypothetical protein
MHERRNFVVTLLFIAALVWGVYVWISVYVFPGLPEPPPSLLAHRIGALVLAFGLGAVLVYAYRYEDKLEDELGKRTMGSYFERDGLCFAPMVRVVETRSGAKQAEISLYYQNRFDNPCEAVIHLRPRACSMYSHQGARDVHFAFTVQPGAYGVIHQPVAVPHECQGESVQVELAAAVRWPRGHGDCLRSRQGRACGTFEVDWALAFRQSHHELGGEIELKDPVSVQLTMPEGVREEMGRSEYTIEVFDVYDSVA